jgi:hypothetical protein
MQLHHLSVEVRGALSQADESVQCHAAGKRNIYLVLNKHDYFVPRVLELHRDVVAGGSLTDPHVILN